MPDTTMALPREATRDDGASAGEGPRRAHVVITVNAAWNVWNFRRPIVEALLGEGHRVTVLAPADKAVPALQEMGCRFFPLTMDSKGLGLLRDLLLLRQLGAVLRRQQPDILLSYTVKSNIYGALAARALGVPCVANVSGLGTAFLSSPALRLLVEQLYRVAFKRVATVFFQNPDDRELFVMRRLVRADQARVLPGSGLDLAHFAPADYPQNAPPVFLMIARLLRDKGVHEFVEAARLVRQVYPKARFHLLGAVAAQNRTAIDRATVDRWQKTGDVGYLGECEDVRPHIAAAGCVVLPSYREGAPRTLMEAAAMARPVIATDVAGCRSVVENAVTGFLCQARSAESLAAACLRFLRLPFAERAALGRAGRAKMEREYDQAHVVAGYRKAIAEALGERSPITELAA